jgi:hypothetical protein
MLKNPSPLFFVQYKTVKKYVTENFLLHFFKSADSEVIMDTPTGFGSQRFTERPQSRALHTGRWTPHKIPSDQRVGEN